MILSARALAVELGVSHTAVNKAHSTGRIKREPCGGFDLEKCRAAWNVNVNIHQQARGAGPNRVADPRAEEPERERPARQDQFDDEGQDEHRFSTAKIQRLAELEKLSRLRRENSIAMGELLSRTEVLGVFAKIGKIYAGVREAIPDEVSPQLIGKPLDEIERILAAALFAADERICREIEGRFPVLVTGTDDTGRAAA